MLRLSALFLCVAASEVPVALVPNRMIAPLAMRLNTSWRLVPTDAATAADIAAAVAVVPDQALMSDRAFLESLTNARLFQLDMTGYDTLNISAIPGRFAVCNVHNAGTAIPEYVLAAILSWNVRLPWLDARFRRCAFQEGASGSECARPPVHRETRGQTVGIIGYGTLGAGVGTRAAALGMRVVAVTSRPPAVKPPELAWVGSDTMLPQLFGEADFIVVSLPLLPSTRGLINASLLRYMKPTGVLINVARAAIVDEAGLYQALEEKRIGGAILDVWWSENWVNMTGNWSRFNFSALPNVWMTPHISYDTSEAAQEGVTEVAANFDALVRGEPLKNVVRNSSARADAIDQVSV